MRSFIYAFYGVYYNLSFRKMERIGHFVLFVEYGVQVIISNGRE
jgi:hypothetical protein